MVPVDSKVEFAPQVGRRQDSRLVNAQLERQDRAKAGDLGVKCVYFRSDGRFRELLYVDGGPSTTQTVGHLRMVGNQVFKHAVSKISESVKAAAKQTNIPVSEIDWFVPHQANQRITDAVASRLGVPEEKVYSNIAEHGNTSSASIPIALDECVEAGRIKEGDLVLMASFGGGVTWGAVLMQW